VQLAGRLFFKWITQHLQIKAFFGTAENTVKSQLWIAVSVHALAAIVKKRLNIAASLYEIQGTSTAAPSNRPARRSAKAWLACCSG
jgi:alpha-beta hydrolase superfamily lysophospholipase